MNPKTGSSAKIFWTRFAKECLKDISLYYNEAAGPIVSKKIRQQIFHATRHLVEHPESGQIELLLEGQDEQFRYCLAGNYKIIYTIIKEGILITDVFDTRQNPVKINNPRRKQ